LAGAQSTIYNTLLTSTLQSNLPGDTLGRASAITGFGSTLLVPLGMGLAGVAAGAVGASAFLLAGAGLARARRRRARRSPPRTRPCGWTLTRGRTGSSA
jgi:hypothetical protein